MRPLLTKPLGFSVRLLALVAAALPCAGRAPASDLDEFKVKRDAVFEFAEPPKVTRRGDIVEIAFASKSACDVTVAIENADGRIVRHLACGVLGSNAPAPFQKNSLRQAIVWDGKDDEGKYIDEKDALAVRVSLGLRASFERALFWSPYKRTASKDPPLMQATPEGVYVLDSKGTDHIRLYDHKGEYVRTIYPFPREMLDKVEGLTWQTAPQDGQRLPIKQGIYQCTLLTSGVNATTDHSRKQHGLFGSAATAMAVRNGRIVLAYDTLNRFSTDGTTGGVPLSGPKVTLPATYGGDNFRVEPGQVSPKSAALSPDGKWLYLAGYTWDKLIKDGWYHNWNCMHCVVRMDPNGDRPPELFVGSLDEKGRGTDNAHFTCAASVACDPQGRVYVADYMNDRIQVFSPDAKHLKTIPVPKPVEVRIHQRTGEIYVFSWMFINPLLTDREMKVPAVMTRFGPFEKPERLASCPLPLEGYVASPGGFKGYGNGHSYRLELDSWADPPVIWLIPGVPSSTTIPGAKFNSPGRTPWHNAGIRLLVEKNGTLEIIRDFAREAERAITRIAPPDFYRQRLYVNPATSRLYLAEDLGFNKSFMNVLEIDPATGRGREVALPFDAEDMAFDLNGLVYLRTRLIVGRYDPQAWREVPFDYGEERPAVTNGGGKSAPMISGIPLHSGTLWHHGGMAVSARGHLVVSCTSSGKTFTDRTDEREATEKGKPYEPRLYPGRVIPNKGAIIHIWDKHGKTIHEDCVQGLSNLNGTFIDKDDAIYVMSAQRRILDGKPYFNSKTGTVMKFLPGKARIVSSSDHAQVPLPASETPKGPPQLIDHAVGSAWAVGAEWLYGGAGFDPVKDNYCGCSNSRFGLDHFARSFVPETDHYSVAVLDTNGSLILRIGKYGNADDGVPIQSAGRPGIAPRPIGGDEVAIFYAPYLAVDTDRRLFIADAGNARIAAIRLDYHATEKIPLKNVPDGK